MSNESCPTKPKKRYIVQSRKTKKSKWHNESWDQETIDACDTVAQRALRKGHEVRIVELERVPTGRVAYRTKGKKLKAEDFGGEG